MYIYIECNKLVFIIKIVFCLNNIQFLELPSSHMIPYIHSCGGGVASGGGRVPRRGGPGSRSARGQGVRHPGNQFTHRPSDRRTRQRHLSD